MAATAAETSSTSGTKPEQGSRGKRRGERKPTVLDDHIDRPSVTQPGDGPFDTTDPDERAISVSPDKAAAARAGHQTVNAVVPAPVPEAEDDDEGEHRTEKYKVRGPDGKLVTVERDLETGESKVS